MTNHFMDNAVAKCRGDSRYTDYEEDEAPSTIEAALMCAGCPIFDGCKAFAEKVRPTHGVWGGQVWEMSSQRGRKRKQ